MLTGRITLLYAVLLALLCIAPQNLYADSNIPIPPERPKILNVPQSYLEELSRKGEPVSPNNMHSNQDNTLLPLSDEDILEDITGQDVFDVIENREIAHNNAVPVSGESAFENSEEDTLISFPLQPGVVKFDYNTVAFLREHVLLQLQQESDKKIEIRAYATPLDGEDHSKIRISLARALEIRQFMIEHGINSKRIKLNTLGDQNTLIEKDDRIDLILKN